MKLRKNFSFSILVFSVALIVLSTYCYAEDCGFGGGCPPINPPCYGVTFSGIRLCQIPCYDSPFEYVNRTYICEKYPNSCQWHFYHTETIDGVLTVGGGGVGVDLYHHGFLDFSGSGSFGSTGSGSASNGITIDDTCCDEGEGQDNQGYGGSATYWPIWDCSACNNCDNLNMREVSYKSPMYYGNLTCCPKPTKGEEQTVAIICHGADYVIPDILLVDPNGLVTVTSDPAGCAEGDKVVFTIKTKTGVPPAKATVTCTASFITESGDYDSESITISILPSCGKCCEDCGTGVL